jgi:hypothetical protein
MIRLVAGGGLPVMLWPRTWRMPNGKLYLRWLSFWLLIVVVSRERESADTPAEPDPRKSGERP